MMSIVTVCARGGSKGVKGKNVRPMLGVPLIVHTLKQAKLSNLFDEYAVSSDSDEILNIAKNEGFLAIKRSLEMSSDDAAKVPVIRHCVQAAEEITHQKFDYCFDLDCTSPLRNIDDIRAVMEMIKYPNVSNVITAMPARRSPYFNLIEMSDNGKIDLAKIPDRPIIRRQDAPKCFDMNASIYAWKREKLMSQDSLFFPTTALHIMPEERSIDIDSELDFEVVEMIMKKRGTI